jgi:hypothetical protein
MEDICHSSRAGSCQKPPVAALNTGPMRKPSSLISCSHCAPEGAVSTSWVSCGGIYCGSGFWPGRLNLAAAERLTVRAMQTEPELGLATLQRQIPHSGGETSDPLACFKSLVDERCGQRAGQSDPEHDRETPNLVFQGHLLADQLLAGDDQ